MKFKFLFFTFALLLLLNQNVSFSQVPYTCSNMEEPIVGDWGFKNIGNGLESPWSKSQNVLFYTDDNSGSSAYSLAGYFYAEFLYDPDVNTTGMQTSTLSQYIELPPLDPNDINSQYYLEYFLSSQFETNIGPVLYVNAGDTLISTYNGNLLLGDLERVNLPPYIQNFTITFKTEYSSANNGGGGGGSVSTSGFRIGSVIIRKITTNKFPTLYVDVLNGSDRNGNGSMVAPYSTIQQALSWIEENGTIYLADGTYCNLASYLPISRSVNIISSSGDPNKTILSGEYKLNLFKISYSNQPQLLSSRRGNSLLKRMESFYNENNDISVNSIMSLAADSSTDSSSTTDSSSSSSSSSDSPNSDNGVSIYVNGLTVGYAYSSLNSPGGAALFIEGNVTATFSNCIFVENSDNQNRGSISARGDAILYLSNSVVRNCSQESGGPAISMLGFGGSPTISLVGCTLVNNQYNILVDETSYFKMENTNIIGTNIHTSSLCSIMLSRTDRSDIINCNITNISIGALCIISSITNIQQTNFVENNLSDGPGGNIYISQSSQVNIDQVVIRDSSGAIGGAIFAMELSNVNVNNSIISNVSSSSLISSSDSQLSFHNSVIDSSSGSYIIYLFFGGFQLSNSNVSNSGGAFYATQTSINITNSEFKNLVASSHVFQDCTVNIAGSQFLNQNGFFYSSFSNINIMSSYVFNSSSIFLMISPLSNVYINGCNFVANTQTIINLLSQSNLTVYNSHFKDNTASITSNAVLMQYEGSTSSFTNVLFENNQSPSSMGGCIFTYSSVLLNNCTAIKNGAKQGGVISTTIDGSLITINGGTYSYNNATGGGAVIFYSGEEPIILGEPVFSNNFAAYGTISATEPSQIIPQSDQAFPPYFQSGNTTFSGVIFILDARNQTVVGIEVKIFLQISGNTIDSATTNTGIAIFNNTILYGPIGQNVTAEFLSNNPNLPIIQSSSTVEKCPNGSIPSATKIECTPCRIGSYGINGTMCVQCPPIHANCPGGATVQQFPGYWYDVNQLPYQLYQCPNVNCLGTDPSNCKEHSFGALCAQCEPGYYDWGDGCKSCDTTSPILFIAIFVVSVGMIILVQSSDSESGLMTVIIYFAQTLMVLSNGVKFNFLALLNLEFQPSSSGSSSIFGICPGPFDYYQQHYFTLLSAPWLIMVLLISTVLFYIVYRYKLIQKVKSKIIKEQQENDTQSNANYSNIIITNNLNNDDEPNQKKGINSFIQSLEKQSLLNSDNNNQDDVGVDNGASAAEPTNDNNDDNEPIDDSGYRVIKDSKTNNNNNTFGKSIDATNTIGTSLGSTALIENTPSNQTFLSQQMGAFIKLMLNIYTPIGKATFEIFFCENIGVTAFVLIANNGVSCLDSEYKKALMVSYALLVVIIGFPLILMVLLFLNRKSLNDPHTQRTYGVFILKYKSSFYFWDVILLLRRLLIILMSTMDPTSAARSFLLVVVSLVSVLLQLKYQPYKRISDNRLELTSLSLLFICCVYLDNTVYQSIEQWIVIASSIIFFLHAVYILYSNYRYQIIDSLQHYLYVISRGRKGRKNSNNTLFGSNSYFLYNQDHIHNDDDFSHNGIFSRKDKKQPKNNIEDDEENNNKNKKNKNKKSNTIEELNNNYYDDSDDYDDSNDSYDSDDDEDNIGEDDSNNESTNLLKA